MSFVIAANCSTFEVWQAFVNFLVTSLQSFEIVLVRLVILLTFIKTL